MRKSIRIIIPVLLCCVLFVLPAFAAGIDIGYSGELDRQSDQPSSSGGNNTGTGTSATRVPIGNDAYYDTKGAMYYYRIGQAEVGMSLPSGILTTSPVTITFPEGVTGEIYLDGNKLAKCESGQQTVPGNYVVLVGGSGASAQSLKFTIVKKNTGAVNGYRVPDGFTVKEAKFDDQRMECAGYVDMTAEGQYNVVIRCNKTGVTHSLVLKVDHTAPTLKLEAVVDGHAKGPVDISDREAGSVVTVYHNGSKADYGETLTKSGDYKVEIADEAGNKTVYQFHIDIYFNFSGILFIVLAVGGIALLFVFLRLKSKRLRIR